MMKRSLNCYGPSAQAMIKAGRYDLLDQFKYRD